VQKWVQASPLRGLTEAFLTQPIADEDCTSDNAKHTYLHVVYCLSLVKKRHCESFCSEDVGKKRRANRFCQLSARRLCHDYLDRYWVGRSASS
jgi:hypothetical protein